MKLHSHQHLLTELEQAAIPLSQERPQYTRLLAEIGDKRIVLLGEATHGTHEFYQTRIEITKQLIKQKGFMAVAIEGDWPDVYHMNRYLLGELDKAEREKALAGFNRFPRWMWRNTTLLPFLSWLREHNDPLPLEKKVGMYGLDLYSLYSSIQAVLNYLEKTDPQAAQQARARYNCLAHYASSPQEYGYMVAKGLKHHCAKEVSAQLLELQNRILKQVKNNEHTKVDKQFYVLQNARLVKNAEAYYRVLFEGRASAWNIRAQHMMETLNNLIHHLETRYHQPAKVIVWAHNSHLGDARATEMSDQGKFNIGQLAKENYPEDVFSLGFSTYEGTVTAASDWGGMPECKRVNPALPESYEDLFHQVPHNDFLLLLTENELSCHKLTPYRLQRAIGVIYIPEAERRSHYFFTRLPQQFDAIIHIDQTTAVEPLDKPLEWQRQTVQSF